MANFHDIQLVLDRVVGNAPTGNHGAFWRGRTRDEFVKLEVFGLNVVVLDYPERSLLVHGLKGNVPFNGDASDRNDRARSLCMAAEQPAASSHDIETISNWIAQGCPDDRSGVTAAGLALGAAVTVDDAAHVRFWRSVDFFFLPGLSSEETGEHVGRLHMRAFGPWKASNILGQSANVWEGYINQADVQESFRYIRLHQTRLIEDAYGESQDNLFDSLWKFGGNLLPPDPQIQIPPRRTMNSPFDWFWWIPYLETSLRANDLQESDLRLARAWQVGIVADGLIRGRLAIPDFNAGDPNLETKVKAAFENAQKDDLIDGMINRAVRFADFPGFPFPEWPQP